MSFRLLLRLGVVGIVGTLFLVSLLGIVVTGPVVVTPPHRDPGIRPSAARLEQTVRTLSTDLAPRSHRDPRRLDDVARWIEERLSVAGLEVEIQEYELPEGTFRNVIGLRRGSDPTAGALVLGAHYDAYGELPGANDNASGVAVLLEVAHNLERDRSPMRDRYFVAFSTEEPPFFGTEAMGSHRFARLLIERGVAVELMVALDLVGFYSDAENSQHFPVPGLGAFYPDRGNFIAVVGDLRSGAAIQRVKQGMMATRALPVRSFRGPVSLGVHLSDHASFRKLGLPGVLVTDTAFLRYPHYHTAEDTPEKLDYERMARLVVALCGVF